jgi:hypothetical protein
MSARMARAGCFESRAAREDRDVNGVPLIIAQDLWVRTPVALGFVAILALVGLACWWLTRPKNPR